MDNKAQVAMEYLAIIVILVIMASIMTLMSLNIFGIKSGIKEQGDLYTGKILEMIK